MNKTLRSLLPIAFCAPILAQGGTVPPGYDTVESSGSSAFAYLMGYYPNMRCQVSNSDLTGKGVQTMAEISFRQDGGTYSTSSVGRTWSNLTLLMCETNASSLSTTWTANHLTMPTTVYSSQHSWPDMTTQPPGTPNPWDNAGLKFPFTSRFLYSGANDLLLDITMLGGSLANGAAWGTNSTGTSPGAAYYLDGRSVITSVQGPLYTFSVPSASNACTFDSSVTPNTLFGGYGYWVTFTDTSPTNQFRWWNYRAYMPNNTMFIQALSLNGSTTLPAPTPGLGCQPLIIDLTQLFSAQPFTTSASGSYSQPIQYTKYVASAVGLFIWSQGIWNDSVTKATKLTGASRC